jgi:hypothetical protein
MNNCTEWKVEKHKVKNKEVLNDWNYDTSCMLTSFLVFDLIFVAQSVPNPVTYFHIDVAVVTIIVYQCHNRLFSVHLRYLIQHESLVKVYHCNERKG